ncbi:MAG: ATP-binding cassette domain-containing protein [Candidatus Saccharimonadales bacterium]
MIGKKIKFPFLDIASVDIKRNKSFSLKIASLAVNTRGIVCLVGANGSGKTTLLETVVGLLSHEKGSIHILGSSLKLDAFDAKTKLGYIPDEDDWIIAELTAREYFDLHVAIYKEAGIRSKMAINVEDMASQLSFSSFDQRMGSLSHGNKKKVQIIVALMHEPAVIVVDELRNGLDPISIKSAENLLLQKSRQGAAVLAATHDLWWAERIAKRIIMIKDGQILLDESTKKIVKISGSLENKFMQLYGQNV